MFLSEGHDDVEAGSKTAKVASKGCGDGAGPQGRASPRFPQGPAVPGCGLLSLPLPAFPEEAEGPPQGVLTRV